MTQNEILETNLGDFNLSSQNLVKLQQVTTITTTTTTTTTTIITRTIIIIMIR